MSELISPQASVWISILVGILVAVILSKGVPESEAQPQCLAGLACAVAAYLLMDLLISISVIFLLGFLALKFGPNLLRSAATGKAQFEQAWKDVRQPNLGTGLGYTPPQPNIAIEEILQVLEAGGDIDTIREVVNHHADPDRLV